MDKNGVRLVSEEISAEAKPAMKVFNLKNLPAGSYSVVVAMDNKETIQPITITEEDIFIEEGLRQVYLVPTIKVGDKYVDVSWLNSRISDLSFEIMSPEGTTIFEDELNNVFKVERRYNIEQLRKGEYTMIVSTPYKAHYRKLEVE